MTTFLSLTNRETIAQWKIKYDNDRVHRNHKDINSDEWSIKTPHTIETVRTAYIHVWLQFCQANESKIGYLT